MFFGLGAILHDPLKPGIFLEPPMHLHHLHLYLGFSLSVLYDLVVLLNMAKLFVKHGKVGYIT